MYVLTDIHNYAATEHVYIYCKYLCMYVCSSGIASLDLMVGHTFYKTMPSYWHAGSYVRLYTVVVKRCKA